MSKKILIVEDNADLSGMYQIAFESKDYEVNICSNGMHAVAQVDSFNPDIILLDIMMPFVSGLDFLKTIRAKGNDITIIINSNLGQDSDVSRAIELGADKYLKKTENTPFEVVEIVDKMLESLGSSDD